MEWEQAVQCRPASLSPVMPKFSPHCQAITWQHPLWDCTHSICTPNIVGFPYSESVCDQPLPNPSGTEPAGQAVGSFVAQEAQDSLNASCNDHQTRGCLETQAWEQCNVAGLSAQWCHQGATGSSVCKVTVRCNCSICKHRGACLSASSGEPVQSKAAAQNCI